MESKRVTINIRRDSYRRSGGDNSSCNLLGISLEQHEKQVEEIFIGLFMKIVNDDLPASLLNHKFIKKREDYDADEFGKYIENTLELRMDKLSRYLEDNLFKRQEVLAGESKVNAVKNKLDTLAHRVLVSMLKLAKEMSELATERAERAYRAQMNAFQVKVKQFPRSEEQNSKIRKLENGIRAATSQLRIRNQNRIDKNLLLSVAQKGV